MMSSAGHRSSGDEQETDMSNKRRRLSGASRSSESGSETDLSFEVVGEREADQEGAQGDEVDLMRVLSEAENGGEEQSRDVTETIDLEDEAAEQQVVDVPPDENEEDASPKPPANKAVRNYLCPICFDPPDTAVMTPCGHIFCVACLFQMVNSSRSHRKSGNCALCRSEVKLRDIRLVVLRKKRVRKTE